MGVQEPGGGERGIVEVDAHFEDGVLGYAEVAADWGHWRGGEGVGVGFGCGGRRGRRGRRGREDLGRSLEQRRWGRMRRELPRCPAGDEAVS